MPLSEQVLVGKLNEVKFVVEKWIDAIEEGIPGIHTPDESGGEALANWLKQFCGELVLSSRELETIAEIIAGTLD